MPGDDPVLAVIHTIVEYLIGRNNHLDHHLRVERHKAQDHDRVRDKENARDPRINDIYRIVKERIPGRYEIHGDGKRTVERRVDHARLHLIRHILRAGVYSER